MDHKKNHIIFYCSDIRNSNFSKLESEGASGTISSMLWVAEGLAKTRNDVTIINEKSKDEPYLERGVHFLGLESQKTEDAITKNQAPKLIICVGIEYSDSFRKLLERTTARVWFWHHNPIKTIDHLKILKEKSIEKHIFVSLNHALRHIKINATAITSFYKKINIIYNPIDFNLLAAQLSKCTSHPLQPKVVKCAYVGNTSLEKGYLKFIELKNRVNANRSLNVEWHVFGGGLYNIKDFNMSQPTDTIIHGTIGRTDLYKKLNEFDFIACGLGGNETYCVSAIEAAYLGKKILTNRKGGQIETLSRFNFKYDIDSVTSSDYLTTLQQIRIPKKHLEQFHNVCYRNYSLVSVVRYWDSLIEDKRKRSCFLGNLPGAIRSMGIFK
ncbi:glycosyltransferase family protein [Pseudomonas gregormendelii]